ncbi:MAG: beta-N-acetylhexosaminidase [Marinoscillum sp.]|uniref:beta-N-acetylhexosaminidase n=1 Tax=Marinoscillum sp. TaxID=2024838 RepID=UPI0032FD0F7C
MIKKSFQFQLVFVCILFGPYLSAQETGLDLMPVPKQVEIGEGQFVLNKDFSISLTGNYHQRLAHEATRFLRRLDQKTALFFTQHKVSGELPGAELVISVERPGEVRLHEDESYQLRIDAESIELKAQTDIGAIRGLETLLQLVGVSNGQNIFPVLTIHDSPRFHWRGLMLDVARHFMPMDVLYRTLDAMAAVKLNVLHLHLVDDQGFRFPTKAFPELLELSTDGQYYTREDLDEIIAYAHQRGIRVIPEIDVPGHATAILVAFPELGSKDTTYTLERFSGIFDPTLDPTNDAVYDFLDELFSEVAEVFPDPYFHIGGDENLGRHWNENEEIQAFMKANNLATNHDLQTYFNIRIQKILNKYGKHTMGWDEIMTPEMPKSAIIHSWRGNWEGMVAKQTLYDAARAGYETVLSNGYYLDLMMPASQHYLVDPAPAEMDLTEAERSRILGGEMCMWSELVIPETIDSRLWPRAAAVAERLWSPEEIRDVQDMYRRLSIISLQLEQLGLKHISSRNAILRKLAKSREIEPLKVLVEVVEPMKGYTRNTNGTLYTTFSPFMLWADAATADATVARVFNEDVGRYLSGKLEASQLRTQLDLWSNNHKKVLPIIKRSPALSEIESLSENLSRAAAIGLEAIGLIESGGKPSSGWVSRSQQVLEEARENGGRTELQMISGIAMLVDELKGL